MTGDEAGPTRRLEESPRFLAAMAYANEMCDAVEAALADPAVPTAPIQALLDQAMAACHEAWLCCSAGGSYEDRRVL